MPLVRWIRRLRGKVRNLLRRKAASEDEQAIAEEKTRVEALAYEVLVATRVVLTHPCAKVHSSNQPNGEKEFPYDGGAIGLLNAGEDCEWPQRILSPRQIDELIHSSKLLPYGAYLTQQLNAPCGDLGGFWHERTEWQVLGIAVCKKIRIRERIREQVLFAAEKENVVRRVAACTLGTGVAPSEGDGFRGLTLRPLVYERDFAPDATPEARKEWRDIASKLRQRFFLSALHENENAKRKPAVQVESVIRPETPTKSSRMLLKTDEYMSPGIAHMRTLYKQAGHKLTECLYEAAKPHCRISAYMFVVEREYTPDYLYDDGSIGRTTRETLYLPKDLEAYQNVATIVADEAPERITREVLSLLRQEIAGRRVVDAWHNELLDGSPQKSGLGVHKKFTEGLETMFPISQKVVIACSNEEGREGGKDKSLALPDITQPNLSGATAFDSCWRTSVKQLEYHAGVMRKRRDVIGDTWRLEALLELPCWAVCYI
ncbi:hypothetical protein KC332_g12934 [Hortaea werneckii]|nr:hypothetical protein KC350_g10449 [Hortaea werneckii]KAI6838665.1 hypothetical protein KC358_g4815 [Hortaea werneckii]KAI6924301.1 hypothetical protein KC348_g9296 [Hortaea werneckii]KAI6945249.1 hypothetical protein KC341_g267 [Hortaea werneckii]KAI6973232.1 hypothetical protein KC321_g5780 [Hortaea werneckii]